MPNDGFWVDHPPYSDPEDLRYVTLRIRAGTQRRFRTLHLPAAPPGNDEARLREILEELARLREVETQWKAGRAPIAKVADAAERGLRRIARGVASLRDDESEDE